jgi:hypothetical protein
MTATNHALTGALIGLTVQNPWLALPAAFISHIVCDILPHFGAANPDWLSSKSFKVYLLTDAALCGLLVLGLGVSHRPNWLLASLCAFVAAAPDFLWIRKFLAILKGKSYTYNVTERFLADIQWFQKPIGAVVEAAWFVGAVVLLGQFF